MADDRPQPIQPAAFEPLAPGAAPKRTGPPTARLALAAALALFLLALWFLLTSRSLEVNVIAEGGETADVNLSGLNLPLGGRFLLRPGRYTLRVVAAGYHPYESTIEVGREASQRIDVAPRPLPGRLTLDVTPADARVSLDGEVIGSAPLADLDVEAGEHLLRIEAPRYRALEQPLVITGRQVQQRLDLALEPAWAEVTIATAPAAAAVLVDGEHLGTTPATVEVLEGERILRLELAGYAPLEQELTIEAGVPIDLATLTLTPEAARQARLTDRKSGVDGQSV